MTRTRRLWVTIVPVLLLVSDEVVGHFDESSGRSQQSKNTNNQNEESMNKNNSNNKNIFSIDGASDVAINSMNEAQHSKTEKYVSSLCPLDCRNGSTCVQRQKTTLPSGNTGFEWMCQCQDGFSGLLCNEIPHRQLKKGEKKKKKMCGDLECLHGGQCVEGHEYIKGDGGALCDCRTTEGNQRVNDGGLASFFNESQQYAGKSCETQIQPKEYCHRNTKVFCINGGKCRNTADDFSQQPCTCPDGFVGRHCEYSEADQPVCSLTCSNRGKCQHGVRPDKNYDEEEQHRDPNDLLDLPYGGTINFMHCNCDTGFAGPNCEYEVTQCEGKDRHYCFHGSSCVDLPSDVGIVQSATHKSENICDCGGLRMAGRYCQYLATDFCDNPVGMDKLTASVTFGQDIKQSGEWYPERNNKPGGPFCVNGGSCFHVDQTRDYYCVCDEDNWTGKYCETKVVKPPSHNHKKPTAPKPPPRTKQSSPPPTTTPNTPKSQGVQSENSRQRENYRESRGDVALVVFVVLAGVVFFGLQIFYIRQRFRVRHAQGDESSSEDESKPQGGIIFSYFQNKKNSNDTGKNNINLQSTFRDNRGEEHNIIFYNEPIHLEEKEHGDMFNIELV